VLDVAAVVDRLYGGNAECAERSRAIMLSVDSTMTALMTGRNGMEIMWNGKKVSGRV
jgi:hypothetical protein